MTADEKFYMAKCIYDAFVEGYNSYATPANAYNTVGQAWEESTAKSRHTELVREANEMRNREQEKKKK
jgi:hypothetical protein